MNRAELQKLLNIRLREARVLFAAGEYNGAYYLAGYAVECALKACFAKGVKRYDFPSRKNPYTHKLMELVIVASLSDKLLLAKQENGRFAAAWDFACKWTKESRYLSGPKKTDAEELLNAIVRRKDGVLPWIKRHW